MGQGSPELEISCRVPLLITQPEFALLGGGGGGVDYEGSFFVTNSDIEKEMRERSIRASRYSAADAQGLSDCGE